MSCQYCLIGDYFGMCTCSITNSQCPFMRRCSVERRWLPLGGMDNCTLQNKRKVKTMLGANEYKVQFERSGKLYIERNGAMIKIANPFDYTPDTIELVQVDNELYIKGFEPKKVEPKKADQKKAKKPVKKKDK